MPEVCEAAPAKINLYLHVVGRRQDGYHLLDSLVAFAGIGDRLWAEPADRLTLTLSGPFAGPLQAEADNLVLRAARGLAQFTGVTAGAALRLEKNLPVASGIGGGSADAAAALRALCRLWGISPARDAMAELARRLGADVPVCLRCEPALMSGIGEQLAPVPDLPEAGLVLVNPGIAVATPAVFKARTGAFSQPARLPRWDGLDGLVRLLRDTTNDLQAPAVMLAPDIQDVLVRLQQQAGCLLARMSGSGATCFGLFAAPEAARAAASGIRHAGWWVWGGGFNPSRGL